MAEFTGERLIPGQVDVDLLNEHMARYVFAARLARGKRVLDAGCGSGYGSAELAQTALWVVGADTASDAVDFAAANYALPNLRFEQASCTALPHADGAFDLVVSFEVIEHLEDWRSFLSEVRRVLAPTGQFIVSTPNKLYYTESRGTEGSNPFHVHEFEFEELRRELKSVFPHVSLFFENHVEAMAFQPEEPDTAVEVRVEAGEPDPADSHFFVAVCAHRSQIGCPTFLYVPGTANVLRERERHIALLEAQLAAKHSEHLNLLELFRDQTQELERSNRRAAEVVANLQQELERSNQWAAGLDARVLELQAELVREREHARGVAEGYKAKVAELESELQVRADWAHGLQEELTASVAAGAAMEREIRGLNERLRQIEELMQMVRASRWVKLGRIFRVGPAI